MFLVIIWMFVSQNHFKFLIYKSVNHVEFIICKLWGSVPWRGWAFGLCKASALVPCRRKVLVNTGWAVATQTFPSLLMEGLSQAPRALLCVMAARLQQPLPALLAVCAVAPWSWWWWREGQARWRWFCYANSLWSTRGRGAGDDGITCLVVLADILIDLRSYFYIPVDEYMYSEGVFL